MKILEKYGKYFCAEILTSWSTSQLLSSIHVLKMPSVSLTSDLFPVKFHYFPFPWFIPIHWWKDTFQLFLERKIERWIFWDLACLNVFFYSYIWLLFFQGTEFLSNLHPQFWKLMLASMVTTEVLCHSVPYLLYIWPVFISWSWQNYLYPSIQFLVRSIFILHPGCLVGSSSLNSLSFGEIILNHFLNDSSSVYSL